MIANSPHGASRGHLPHDIYISLVTSLFSDPKTLVVGSLGTIGACLITAIKTWDWAFAACTLALALVSVARAYDVRAFNKRGTKDIGVAEARHWELRYVAGSALYVLLMGIWCFMAFAKTSDPVVQLLSFSMTLVNMIGVAGRNFGSKLLVGTQLVCSGIPMIAGLFWIGDIFYAVIGCVLAPFFVSFQAIANRLRMTLTGAVVAAREVQLLADRLDAALNNMAHGLCMIDQKGAIAISNHRLPDIIGVHESVFQPGRMALSALMECVRSRVLPGGESKKIIADIALRMSGEERSPLAVTIRGDRILLLTFRGMPDGSSVVLVEDGTQQRNAAARISRLAHFDSLTGLPNRVLFLEEIRRILGQLAATAACAILFVDLDDFKQVNDTLGHPCGDKLLEGVAERLRVVVGEDRLIARLGGDEFIVIQSPLGSEDDAAHMARRIVEALSVPFEVDGQTIITGASVGIAIAPRHGCDPDTLLKNADMALYRAKSEGRGTWRFFAHDMELRANERRSLELDLREALRKNAFELHYQPILNIKTRRIVGCEALLRWSHPDRGAIPPAKFIPLAEEIGLIVEMGAWVIKTACHEAARWPTAIRVAVNLSPMQFRQKGIVDAVKEALQESGLSPGRLELEITESVLLQDSVAVLQTLGEINQLGVRISLDDFGTGYSSLSYLRKFPLHTVKIDRSFLAGIEHDEKLQILMLGISNLCSALGLSVVVEGVETSAQLDQVMKFPGLQEVQGYLFAKPAPATFTRNLLKAFDQGSVRAINRRVRDRLQREK